MAKDRYTKKMLYNMKILFVKFAVREVPKGLSGIGKRVLYYLRTCKYLTQFIWIEYKALKLIKKAIMERKECHKRHIFYFKQ